MSDDTPAEVLPPEKQMFAPPDNAPAQKLDFPKATPRPTTLPLAEAADRVKPRRRSAVKPR